MATPKASSHVASRGTVRSTAKLFLAVLVVALALHLIVRFSCPCLGDHDRPPKCPHHDASRSEGTDAEALTEGDPQPGDESSEDEDLPEKKNTDNPPPPPSSLHLTPEQLESRLHQVLGPVTGPGGAQAPLNLSLLADVAASRKGRRAGGDVVLLLSATHEHRGLLLNCFRSLKKLNLGSQVLVLAFDNSTLRFAQDNKMKALAVLGVDAPRDKSDTGQQSSEESDSGSDTPNPGPFPEKLPLGMDQWRRARAIEVPRLCVLLSLLRLHREVLLVDVDTVFLRSPIDAIRKDAGVYPDADVAVASESLSWESFEHGARVKVHGGMPVSRVAFESTPRAIESFGTIYTSAFSAGMMFARPTNATVAFLRVWIAVLLTRGGVLGLPPEEASDDQDVFNRLARLGGPLTLVGENLPGSKPAHSRLIWVFEKRVKLGVLSPAYFVNGHVYFVQKLSQTLHKKPVVIHNNFQFYSTQGKIWRFREASLWSVEEPSWYTKGSFLSFDAVLPEDVLAGIESPIDKHIAAVSFYYLSIRNALAVAQILNRTLILPTVTCYCDRYWWSLTEPCRMPGVDEDPPYSHCPVDLYLNLDAWVASGIGIREHNFLDNPEVPAAYKKGRKVVSVVPRPEGGTASLQSLPKDSIPANALDFEVSRLLRPLARARVIHLETAADAFCRFKSPERSRAFDAATLGAGLFQEDWCCLPWRDEWGEEAAEALRYRRFKPPRALAEAKLTECQGEPTIALDLGR